MEALLREYLPILIFLGEIEDKGFVVAQLRQAGELGAHRLADVPMTFGLACCAVEMMQASMRALRPRPVRHGCRAPARASPT
jgi:NADH:ubiquinone oxidoreductase subunit B-like Fe-S oxidoreductase